MDAARERVVAKYQIDGQRVLSVTEALKFAGLSSVAGIPNKKALAVAADRGREVHSWIELIDTGNIAWEEIKDDLDPKVRARVEAWMQFREDVACETISVEKTYVHDGLRFAGTIDWVGKLNGSLCVLDYKTGTAFKEVALQTAGYALLLEWSEQRVKPKLVERYALYLKATGKYKLVRYDSVADELAFVSALRVAQWKLANGCKLEE